MPWEKGEPSPGLVDFLSAHPELKRGRVAVPGCGTGHDVRAFAAAGFAASGFDIAPSAISQAEDIRGYHNSEYQLQQPAWAARVIASGVYAWAQT